MEDAYAKKWSVQSVVCPSVQMRGKPSKIKASVIVSQRLTQLFEQSPKKYPTSNKLIPLKALTYFEDVNFKVDQPIMIRKIELTSLKNRLVNAIENPEKIFNPEG